MYSIYDTGWLIAAEANMKHACATNKMATKKQKNIREIGWECISTKSCIL